MMQQDHIKVYDLLIKTYSPVFIGTNSEGNYMKKEYLYDTRNSKVLFLHRDNFTKFIVDRNLIEAYENYILYCPNEYLQTFFEKNAVCKEDINDLIICETDAKNALVPNKSLSEIHGFVSDAYFRPYVPGSSIKGALFTAVLYLMIKERKLIVRNPANLNYKDISNDNDFKNIFAGIQFSDSQPINPSDLILVRKDDLLPNGKVSTPNIIRQCVRANVEIKIPLTIDTTKAKIDIDFIIRAIREYSEFYKGTYLKPYTKHIYPINIDNFIVLGGGSGYHGKNIVYPIKKGDAVEYVARLLHNSFKKHKHYHDITYNISPRCLKCTKFTGSDKLHHLGVCAIKIK